MNDQELRWRIYDSFVNKGRAPELQEIVEWVGSSVDAMAVLRRLHDVHAVVLAEDHLSIDMALPFSNSPTQHVVSRGKDTWFANCGWDALAIPIALDSDVHIESRWLDDDSRLSLDVVNGELGSSEGFVHFAIPARNWWEDIVET